MSDEVLDKALKDLVHMTKLIKPLKFTPQKIQELQLQLVDKHSIPFFSDILTERRSIESGYGVQLDEEMLPDFIFNRHIKLIEKYSKDKVRVWATECFNCGKVWDDIIYKTPHDVVCPYCRQKNATITKTEDVPEESPKFLPR